MSHLSPSSQLALVHRYSATGNPRHLNKALEDGSLDHEKALRTLTLEGSDEHRNAIAKMPNISADVKDDLVYYGTDHTHSLLLHHHGHTLDPLTLGQIGRKNTTPEMRHRIIDNYTNLDDDATHQIAKGAMARLNHLFIYRGGNATKRGHSKLSYDDENELHVLRKIKEKYPDHHYTQHHISSFERVLNS
jgi:hypothetical protein